MTPLRGSACLNTYGRVAGLLARVLGHISLWGSSHTVSGYPCRLEAHSFSFALSIKGMILTESKDVPHLCHNRCCDKLEHYHISLTSLITRD